MARDVSGFDIHTSATRRNTTGTEDVMSSPHQSLGSDADATRARIVYFMIEA